MTDRYQPLRDAAHGALRLMFPDDLKLLLAALLAERDVAVEEASRYRGVGAPRRRTAEHRGGRWAIVVEEPPPTKHDEEDAFDAAIDAAREAGR